MPVRPGLSPSPGHVHAPSGPRCCQREEERRGADVSRDPQPEWLQLTGLDRHRGTVGCDVDAAHAQHPLGVIASGERLDDGGRPVR